MKINDGFYCSPISKGCFKFEKETENELLFSFSNSFKEIVKGVQLKYLKKDTEIYEGVQLVHGHWYLLQETIDNGFTVIKREVIREIEMK